MKNFLAGFVCIGLVLFGSVAPGRAQEQPPPDQEQAGPPKPTAPPMPHIPDIRFPGERGISIGISGWEANAKMDQFKGVKAATDYPGNLHFATKRALDKGFDISVAAGAHNMLRFSYFDARGAGNTIAATDLTLWTAHYDQGTYLATNYRVRGGKISFDYLTWPYPVKTSRFRLKTLWQLQYIGATTSFDAPLLPTVDENGNPITDANGNAVNYVTKGSHWFFLPSIGLGAQEYFSPRFSIEVNASGFTIPHHPNTWDIDGAANIRVGHYEVRIGARAFHFRTTPQQDFWMQGTLIGPFIGIRWHSDSDQPSVRQ